MSLLQLSEQNKKKYKKELKKEIEKIRQNLESQKNIVIWNQINNDFSEIKDVGIIIYLFHNDEAPLKYVRTEPLFSFKEKNFDVALYGEGHLILVSVKESVQGGNILKSIGSLKEYSEQISNNITITNTIRGINVRVLDYFEEIIGEKITNKEFVLATQKPCINEIIAKAKELGYQFCLWNLIEKENKAFIIEERIDGKEDGNYFGHRLAKLNDYLKSLKKEGRLHNDILTFMLSSSKWLRAVKISIPLSRREFDFNYWESIFDVDLYNWHNSEKRDIYKSYINHGLECGFLKLAEEKRDILINKYKVVSICSKAPMLEKDIVKKIIKRETKKELTQKIPSAKIKIKNSLLAKQAQERGESLAAFT
ncbi:hypothetical protein K8R30_04815 [archaeon]|nr:hypothetical protein [archaeon]